MKEETNVEVNVSFWGGLGGISYKVLVSYYFVGMG